MMLARHPSVVPARVVDIFKMVKFPYNIAVIVNLNQVDPVLHAIVRMAVSGKAHHISAGKKLWRHGVHVPAPYLVSVHVKQ